jgi:uncharacterized damage-inducible protein DinB
MTANDLLQTQIRDARFQLDKVLEGIDGSHVDGQPIASMMSMRQTMVHLAEAYAATLAELAGEKYEWGSLRLDAGDWTALLAKVFGMRDEAVASLMASADEAKRIHLAHNYIVGHDYYHVGQLSALRIAADPEWDPYSIYGFEA